MAWIEGTEDQEFEVRAELDVVRTYFADPARFCAAFSQLDSHTCVEEGTWRWVLNEKSEKGITFQGDYTVRYHATDDGARWETLEGNMKTTGFVTCTRVQAHLTRVRYRETLAVDLPIPKLAAKIFQPIVAREIRGGVDDFLKRSRAILES